MNPSDLPNLDTNCFKQPERELLGDTLLHPPRILILYGSLRARSFSRLAAEEAGRLLTLMGAEVRFFNPEGLPLVDEANEQHPKVQELRELADWSEGQVWSLARAPRCHDWCDENTN